MAAVKLDTSMDLICQVELLWTNSVQRRFLSSAPEMDLLYANLKDKAKQGQYDTVEGLHKLRVEFDTIRNIIKEECTKEELICFKNTPRGTFCTCSLFCVVFSTHK